MDGSYRGMGSFVGTIAPSLLSSLQSAEKCDGSRSGSLHGMSLAAPADGESPLKRHRALFYDESVGSCRMPTELWRCKGWKAEGNLSVSVE